MQVFPVFVEREIKTAPFPWRPPVGVATGPFPDSGFSLVLFRKLFSLFLSFPLLTETKTKMLTH
jgi:hypothetical protein